MEADHNDLHAPYFSDSDENNNNYEECLIHSELIRSMQLCSCCAQQKATVICSVCSSQKPQSNYDIIPTLKEEIASVDTLMQNGNLLYCKECFPIVHKTVHHKPVDLFPQDDETTCPDIEINKEKSQLDLIVEEKLESLVEQVVNNSVKESEIHEPVDFNNEIECLNQRCKQFNDVKFSIKKMNDLIRDELHLEFCGIATLMHKKLDKLSDKVKEKLKDAYSVVRDIQSKITDKISEVDANIKELDNMRQESEIRAQEMKCKEAEIMAKIKKINDELKSICEPNLLNSSSSSSTFSCSLFVENNLYPQFNYNVDFSPILQAISQLNLQMAPSPPLDENSKLPNPNLDFNLSLDSNLSLNANILSSLSNDGTFWLQIVALDNTVFDCESSEWFKYKFKKDELKLNQFLEEISKFIRTKRICDKEWQTFAELNRMPLLNEKCFSLDAKSRQWLRSTVINIDETNQSCQVRHMDTGFTDPNKFHSLDDLLVWKDFDLAKMPNRSVKCVLHKSDETHNKYEKLILPEARFLFKDLTANQRIRCTLVETINLDDEEQVWSVKIYREDEKNTKKDSLKFFSINEKIIEQNDEDKNLKSGKVKKNNFACTDIRVEAGKVEKSNRIIKTNSQTKSSSSTSSTSSFSPACPNSTIVTESKSKFNSSVNKRGDSESNEVFSVSEELTTTQVHAQPVLKAIAPSNEEEPVLIDEAQTFDTNLDYSSIKDGDEFKDENPNENLDIEDQIDERRFYKSREGSCYVTTTISPYGVFWIRPVVPHALFREFEELSKFIGEFIRRTNYKSYDELKVEPEVNKKCFVRAYNLNNQLEWCRGFIEKVYNTRETCRVRLMDKGSSRDSSFQDVYPHRRLDLNQIAKTHNLNAKLNDYDIHGLKLNYLGIRCCLFQNAHLKLDNYTKRFTDLVNPKQSRFRLIEQVRVGRLKCWYTELENNSGHINKIIFDLLPAINQQRLLSNKVCDKANVIRQSKSIDIGSLVNKENSEDSSVTTSSTNRNWISVETRQIGDNKRSQSLCDINMKSKLVDINENEIMDENKSLTIQETDKFDEASEQGSIQVKSEMQELMNLCVSMSAKPPVNVIISDHSKSFQRSRIKRDYKKNSNSLPHQPGQETRDIPHLNSIVRNCLSIDTRSSQMSKHNPIVHPFQNEPEWDAEIKCNVEQPSQNTAQQSEQVETQQSQLITVQDEPEQSNPINSTTNVQQNTLQEQTNGNAQLNQGDHVTQNFRRVPQYNQQNHPPLPHKQGQNSNANRQGHRQNSGQNNPESPSNNSNQKKRRRNKKPNNSCKPDGQYYKSNNRRDDGNGGGGGGGENNDNGGSGGRFHNTYGRNQTQSGENQSSSGWSQNRNYSNNKNGKTNDGEAASPETQVQIGPPYMVLNNEEDHEQNSSAFNDVFINEEKQHCRDDETDSGTDEEDKENSSLDQDQDVYLNLNGIEIPENRFQTEIDNLESDFQLNHQNRVTSHLNSSPNSPYQKLFKLHVQNSYEQVLSRISENDSLVRNHVPKEPSCIYSRLHDYDNHNFNRSDHDNELLQDEIEVERIRSIEHVEQISSEHDLQNNEITTDHNEPNGLNLVDNSLAQINHDNTSSDIDCGADEHAGQGTTLDTTHQIPNRHIINDIGTNRSINRETNPRGKHAKNRSFSAADVVLFDRNNPNRMAMITRDTHQPRQSSSSSSSSSSSTTSLAYLKKKIDETFNEDENEDNESFESCAEDIKSLDSDDGDDDEKGEEFYGKRSNGCDTAIGTFLTSSGCAQPSTKSFDKQAFLCKKERLKKFTISIFVDEFEADLTNNKTFSNDTSISTASGSPNTPLNKTDDETRFKQNESFFQVSNSRNVVTMSNQNDLHSHKPKSRPKTQLANNDTKSRVINYESRDLEEQRSLKEFEINEARTNMPRLGVQNFRRLTPQACDDDAFMFTPNPNQFSQDKVTSKPPLVPQPTQNTHQIVQSNTNTCLSTIIECSQECSNDTSESCSHRSSNQQQRSACSTVRERRVSSSSCNLDENVHLSKYWLNDMENNSDEFQKKIDFFNKNPTENLSNFVEHENQSTLNNIENIDQRNVTMRRTSRDLEHHLNQNFVQQQQQRQQRKSKSASSLSDNCVLSNSSSNNNLLVDVNQQHGQITTTVQITRSLLTSSASSLNDQADSIVITDRLFEKFCMISNDEIMQMQSLDSSDLSQLQLKTGENKFVANNSERFKIQSKILNDLLDEPMTIQASILASKNNENDKLTDSLSLSSSTTSFSSSESQSTDSLDKDQLKQHEMITSVNKSPKSLEISSYTTDSLFNSHLIITPICSDMAVSPNQFGSIIMKSPLMHQSNQISLNTTSTPQNRFQLQQISTNETSNRTFRSPLTQPSQSNITLPSPPTPTTSHSSSSLPPPPPPLPAPPAPSLASGPVFPLIKSAKPNLERPVKTSGLIESLTAKLNLIANTSEIPPFSKNHAKPTKSLLRHSSSLNSSETNLTATKVFKNTDELPPIPNRASTEFNIKPSTSFNKHINNYLNNVKSSTGTEITSVKRRIVSKKAAEQLSSSKLDNQWKSANFSLYGLDTDEDQDSGMVLGKQRNLSESGPVNVSSTKMRRSISECDSNDSKSIQKIYANLNMLNNDEYQSDEENVFTFPPPPPQFSNSPNHLENENESSSSTTVSQSTFFPPPPPPPNELVILSKEQASSNTALMISSSSSATTVIPASNLIINQQEQSRGPTSPRLSTFMRSIEIVDDGQLKSDLELKKTWNSLKKQSNLSQSPTSLPEPPVLNKTIRTAEKNQKVEKPQVSHYTSCPNLVNDQQKLVNLEREESFKLDRLLDINPKRLFKNSKFRCKIHDVIDESGTFWLEVIYPEEDERKFREIFKLLNLCSRISEPPKRVFNEQRLSALYKGEWHRAIVLDATKSKVKVKFVDLGLVKQLDRNTDLRVIDEKFFNCPLKALECSLYLDEGFNQLLMNNQIFVKENLQFTKEAKKYFVRLVYKKVLLAKVVDFKEEESSSVCKIKLGYATQRGVIDVYMYLLSKFDRNRYELLKQIQNLNQQQQQQQVEYQQKNHIVGIPIQTSIETTTTITNTTQTSNTITSTAVTCPSSLPSPPDSANNSMKRAENHEENHENEYVNEELISDEETGQNNCKTQQTEYDEDDDDEDIYDDALFSDIVNDFIKNNQRDDSSSGTYFSAGLNEEAKDLDYTPVKDLKKTQDKCNYASPLRIDSVHLPPLDNDGERETATPKAAENYSIRIKDASTAKISNRIRALSSNTNPQGFTPICTQEQGNPLKMGQYLKSNFEHTQNMHNCSSDTDTSSKLPCCAILALKKLTHVSSGKQAKTSGYKVTSSSKYNQTIREFGPEDNILVNKNSMMTCNKKVKFHVK